MSMLKEFREFAVKGNVIDLAVGVIIGGAFGKIVTSLVEDVVMPPIGIVLGKVDFANLFLLLPGQDPAKLAAATDAAAKAKHAVPTIADYKTAGVSTLNYGQFLNNVIQFLIIAFVVFLMVKAINRAKKQVEHPAPPAQPTVKQCPYCMSDIPIEAKKCKFCTADLPV